MNTLSENKPLEFSVAAEPKPSFWDRIGHVPAPVHEAMDEGKCVAIRSRQITEKLIRHYPIRAVAAGGLAGAMFGVMAGCVMGYVVGRRH